MKKFVPTHNHLLIFRFINTEIPEIKNNKFFWPRELGIAKKLLVKYPFEFLISLKEPFYPISMKSLAWFLAKDGQNFITENYFEYLQQKTNLTKEIDKVDLQKEKIGKDLEIKKENKTLKDFLEMYK